MPCSEYMRWRACNCNLLIKCPFLSDQILHLFSIFVDCRTRGPAPTSAPTSLIVAIDPCQLSTESFTYFQPEAEVSYYSKPSAPVAIEVPFVYEIETSVEYSAEEMNSELLPKVEQAIGDGILPLIFDECASDDGGETSTFISFVGENIMGITASPPDLAITDETASCSVIQPQFGNSCTVVEGIMTVYVPQKDADITEKDKDVIIMATQDAIQQVMESGTLDDGAIDESIESVSYGQDGPYQEPTVILGADENEPNEGRGGSLAYIGIAGGAVAVGAILAIVGAKMRSRQDEDEDSYGNDEDNENGSDHDISGFHDNPTEIADRGGKRTYDMEPVSGEDWAAVGTTAAVLASASDTGTSAAGDREETDNMHASETMESTPISPHHEDALNRIDAALNSGEWSTVLTEAKNIAEDDEIQSERSDVPSLGASDAASEASSSDDDGEAEPDASVAKTDIVSKNLNNIV